MLRGDGLAGQIRIRGEAVNGLQISISRVSNGGKSSGIGVVQINLHNTGKQDLYTIPGMLQDACEPRNLAGNFKLTMTDSKGMVWRLVPSLVGIICEGNNEPFTLPLPAGTTFSIPIYLNEYSYGGPDGTAPFPQPSTTLSRTN